MPQRLLLTFTLILGSSPLCSAEVIGIVAGDKHTIALTKSGELWVWGANECGQLGDGTLTERLSPIKLEGMSGVRAVAAGAYHTVALRTDGALLAWGLNDHGQLGDATNTNHTAPTQVKGLDNVRAIAAGERHTIALRNDGTVWAWGKNHRGQLGNGTHEDRATPEKVMGLMQIVSIAAGANHTLALREDGTVWAWGANADGQLGDGTTETRSAPVQVKLLADAVAIAAGRSHSVAIRKNGNVLAWGANWSESWQLADGTTMQSSLPVQVSGLSGVPAMGTPVIIENSSVPLSQAQIVAAGDFHTLIIKADGTVWGWGRNFYWGELGNGKANWRSNPVRALGIENAVAVAAGKNHSVALTKDGIIWSWGANTHGQLGIGTKDFRPHPRPIPLPRFAE